MADSYYKPCVELDMRKELIEKYFETKRYEKRFEGHLELALRSISTKRSNGIKNPHFKGMIWLS